MARGIPGPLGRQDDCRGSASRERNHGVGDHPIPFRTRQLSPTSPKVLRRQAAGGQVVPLAGGAFLRSGRPDGTAGPADAAAPTGARPRPLFGARRGAEAAWPRGGAIPGARRTLADFLGRTCATKLYYYLDAHAGVFLFRLVSLHGARSAAGKKPPAMRVRVEGSALASKRRQSGYDTGVQVVSARKGGRFGKQGTQPVAHEVDVQVPHRVHAEV